MREILTFTFIFVFLASKSSGMNFRQLITEQFEG